MEKKKYHILAIRRDDSFSPNSVTKDRAILQMSCDLLGENIPMIDEARLDESFDADVYLSMARFPDTIHLLKQFEDQGKIVINSGYAVSACSRRNLQTIMSDNHFSMPSEKGDSGYWIKRGDMATQCEEDVAYCQDEQALEKAKVAFAERGIDDYLISAHVLGDVIKFYGVGNLFFQYFYPSDDHQTKFSHELVNGEAHHYAFDEDYLRKEVQRLADIISIDVYGGDAIVDKDGRIYIIDFNDWPSFSRCRGKAANAIARLVKDRMS